jgi:hypothetical protein
VFRLSIADIHGVLYSPNCLVAMNITSEAMRLDWGKAYRKAVNYSIVVTLVCVLQIALLFRQLYYSRTQAAASRVSLLTIGQQVSKEVRQPHVHSGNTAVTVLFVRLLTLFMSCCL